MRQIKPLKVRKKNTPHYYAKTEEPSWLAWAGIFKGEPLFDEVLIEIENYRKELDERFVDEEKQILKE